MSSEKNNIRGFQRKWQLLLWLEMGLYVFGVAVFAGLVFRNILVGVAVFILAVLAFSAILRPWAVPWQKIHSFIDRQLPEMENSSELLQIPKENLSPVAQLQREKISALGEVKFKSLKPENNLIRAMVISGCLVTTGLLAFYLGWAEVLDFKDNHIKSSETILFQPTDTEASATRPPLLESQKVTIRFPSYTGIPPSTTTAMNIEALEGSGVMWEIGFDTPIDSASMESMGNTYNMNFKGGKYTRTSFLNASGFYNFRFTDSTGASYISDLYSISVFRDKSPEINIPGLPQFTSFNYDDKKLINFSALITDDFGIDNAYIIATVSKGTGESVKFREERLNFDTSISRGSKKMELKKSISLDQMKMEMGDELYFYIEAMDLKQPQANRSRSETYFVLIKDTVSYGPGVEGTLGVDLMPDYFRSQRQLIIDTEKLITTRNKIPIKDFNSTSNDLGFDQKALRLRYGQFMGDESEGDIEAIEDTPTSEEEIEDPLAAFTHDHDGNNEHNLVETTHESHKEHEDEENENMLDKFLHQHGDPESASLFTDNLRSKLRQTLDIMWDAELHLRLYEPEKSLPFQYKALQLLQEIKNSARIYVHRIGYDPPPIKEEVRLTGKIGEVSNFQKTAGLKKPDIEAHMRLAISRLGQLLTDRSPITSADRELFGLAGNELAQKAIDNPGKYLLNLQQLKMLTEETTPTPQALLKAQRGLLEAISKPVSMPGKGRGFQGAVNKLLLKELQKNGL